MKLLIDTTRFPSADTIRGILLNQGIQCDVPRLQIFLETLSPISTHAYAVAKPGMYLDSVRYDIHYGRQEGTQFIPHGRLSDFSHEKLPYLS